jgi:hypothetical protein
VARTAHIGDVNVDFLHVILEPSNVKAALGSVVKICKKQPNGARFCVGVRAVMGDYRLDDVANIFVKRLVHINRDRVSNCKRGAARQLRRNTGFGRNGCIVSDKTILFGHELAVQHPGHRRHDAVDTVLFDFLVASWYQLVEGDGKLRLTGGLEQLNDLT